MKTVQSLLFFALVTLFISACSEQFPPPDSEQTQTPEAETVKPEFEEGIHYRKLPEPIDLKSDNIVVTEFFWYGCPHCEKFEPFLNEWEKTKADDVILQRIPAVWNESMVLHAKLYFLSQKLMNSASIHSELFKSVIPLRREQDLSVQKQQYEALFIQFGMTAEAFNAALVSNEIKQQIAEAEAIMKKSGMSSTPSIMVNGKYLIINNSMTRQDSIMKVANFLIEKERKEKASQ